MNSMTTASTRSSDLTLGWLLKPTSVTSPHHHDTKQLHNCHEYNANNSKRRTKAVTWRVPTKTVLQFDGSDFQLDYDEESIQLFLVSILEDFNSHGAYQNFSAPKHMQLRNLMLSKQSQQLLTKVLSAINNNDSGLESLTLSNVSCNNDDDETGYRGDTVDHMAMMDWSSEDSLSSSSSSSLASNHNNVLNCDFLCAAGALKLKKLTIERCRFDSKAAGILGQAVALCRIQHFTMNHVTFLSSPHPADTTVKPPSASCDDGLTGQLLGEGLCLAGCSLTTFEVRQVTCDDSHALFSNLLRGLRSCTRLEMLHLEGCGLGRPSSVDEKDDDVRQLTLLVASLQKLNSLILYQNNIGSSGIDILLSQGLSDHPNLQKLVLSQNPIGDDGARHLASFLIATKDTSKIVSLSISACDIWSSGCKALIKSLAVNSTIENLEVDDEWESHLKELSNVLETNMTLKFLATPLSPTMMRSMDEEWKMVEYYLRLNRAKRRILVAEPFVPRSIWPLVIGRSSVDPDVAFHLLQQHPDVIEESAVFISGFRSPSKVVCA